MDSVKVLKEGAKTRKVPASEILLALSNIKKAKLDTSTFFETLGGTESPGRTWMLIFTAKVRIEWPMCLIVSWINCLSLMVY